MPIFAAGPLALLGGAASLGGALIGAGAAKGAANTQAAYGRDALAMQERMFDEIRQSLAPFIGYGAGAGNKLMDLLGLGAGGNPMTSPLLKPFAPTEANLMETPGYKFNLSQGLRATQAGAAARGLGQSGAAERGAAQFAQGLADSTFNERYQQYRDTQDAQFNKLFGMTGLGASAAAGQGNIASSMSNTMGNTITGIGNALAGGTVGMANALSGGLQSLPSWFMMSKLLGGGAAPAGGGMYGPST